MSAPHLCRATHQHVKARTRCALCGNKISFNTLMIVNPTWTVYKHAARVSRALTKMDKPPPLAKPLAGTKRYLKVVVTGGRSYEDAVGMEARLNTVPIASLAHGGAQGADFLAGRWARRHHVPVQVYEADWGRHGRSAGPIRNETMLDDFRPDLVIAFSGGSGTAHCVHAARRRTIPVWETTRDKTALRALASMSAPSG